MVNVEPFIFQKVTAFKERLQMVDKINEIIDAVNSMDIDPEQIQAMIEEALADYYTKEEVDELLANIDFSPYYTKTEVDAIVDRIDGDVDAVEGRLDTAEGDIDALEINKQDVLTGGDGIVIDNNEVSLKGWKMVPLDEWANLLEQSENYYYIIKEDFIIAVRTPDSIASIGGIVGPKQIATKIMLKGMKLTSSDFYTQIPLQVHTSPLSNPVSNSIGVLQVSAGITSSSTQFRGARYYYIGLGKGSQSGDSYYTVNLPDYFDLTQNVTKHYSEDNSFPSGSTSAIYVSVLRRES